MSQEQNHGFITGSVDGKSCGDWAWEEVTHRYSRGGGRTHTAIVSGILPWEIFPSPIGIPAHTLLSSAVPMCTEQAFCKCDFQHGFLNAIPVSMSVLPDHEGNTLVLNCREVIKTLSNEDMADPAWQ